MPAWLSAFGDGIFGRLPYVGAALPIETMCFLQLSPNPGESMLRLCSQAVPKRRQWKIDVWIWASSRQQNGSDAGQESFELRVFLRGLRQKQHRWGAAWCIHKRFTQRFCIESQKTSHGYCLEDVAILAQGKSSRRIQPSCQLDFQHLEMAYLVVSHMLELYYLSKLCVSCSFHQIQASQFCLWKLAGAHFRLRVKRWQVRVLTFLVKDCRCSFQLLAAAAATHQCATGVPRLFV